jgi:hypothetical protein
MAYPSLDDVQVHPVTSDGFGETVEGSNASPDSTGSVRAMQQLRHISMYTI